MTAWKERDAQLMKNEEATANTSVEWWAQDLQKRKKTRGTTAQLTGNGLQCRYQTNNKESA